MPTKPTSTPEWATGGGASVIEPSDGQKEQGHEVGKKTPAGWQNWFQKLVYDWLAYLNAPVGTGAGAAIEGTGGNTSGPGFKGTGGAPNGNGYEGVATGTGAGVKGTGSANASSNGLKGTTTTNAADAVLGTATTAATSTGGGVKGTGLNAYGVIADGDTTSPKRASLRVVPQDADAVDQLKGDVQTDTVTGLLKSSNGNSMLKHVGQLYAFSDGFSDTMGGVAAASGVYFQKTAADIAATLKANTVRVGSTIRVRAWGSITLDADVGPSFIVVSVEIQAAGGATYRSIGAVRWEAPTASLVHHWHVDGVAIVTAIGAGGTIETGSLGIMSLNGSSDTDEAEARDLGAGAVDTTQDELIKVKVTIDGGDAGDSAIMRGFVVDLA